MRSLIEAAITSLTIDVPDLINCLLVIRVFVNGLPISTELIPTGCFRAIGIGTYWPSPVAKSDDQADAGEGWFNFKRANGISRCVYDDPP
jgi:hypothetical protein